MLVKEAHKIFLFQIFMCKTAIREPDEISNMFFLWPG
jgi:hypothetical protein